MMRILQKQTPCSRPSPRALVFPALFAISLFTAAPEAVASTEARTTEAKPSTPAGAVESVAVSTPSSPSSVVRVELHAHDFPEAQQQLAGEGFDVARHDEPTGRLTVITSAEKIDELAALGVIESVQTSRPYSEVARVGGPEERYKDYSEVLAILQQAETDHPEIARVIDLTTTFGSPVTWGGRHLFALKISDHPELDEDEPRVLFDSLHHARELNSIEMTLDIIETLTERYGQDPTTTQAVDELEVWVVPVVNPDGLEFVWSNDQFWRKNRRDNGGGSFGVDINRNYPFQFGECGSNSGDPNSNTYRGPEELSEPETQTMVRLGEALRPVINISYHSSGREVLQPYTCGDLAEAPLIDAVRDIYRQQMDFDWRLASSSGESFEWFYNQVSSIAYLTEVGTDFQPPFDETLDEVLRVRPGWLFLLRLAQLGPIVSGNVNDAITSAPISATLSSSRVNFTEGERRSSDPALGRFDWFLLPGVHDLTVEAPGYLTQQIPIEVLRGGTEVNVEMTPSSVAPSPDVHH